MPLFHCALVHPHPAQQRHTSSSLGMLLGGLRTAPVGSPLICMGCICPVLHLTAHCRTQEGNAVQGTFYTNFAYTPVYLATTGTIWTGPVTRQYIFFQIRLDQAYDDIEGAHACMHHAAARPAAPRHTTSCHATHATKCGWHMHGPVLTYPVGAAALHCGAAWAPRRMLHALRASNGMTALGLCPSPFPSPSLHAFLVALGPLLPLPRLTITFMQACMDGEPHCKPCTTAALRAAVC